MAKRRVKSDQKGDERDDLYDLIQSMSKAERRHFTIYFKGTAHGDLSRYLELFSTLAAMDTYSRETLEKKFDGWTGWKYYSKTKGYLIDCIFDALRAYHKSQSIKEILYDQASALRMLYNRGLLDHYGHLLRQAKSLCYECGEYLPLLDILQTEETYAMRSVLDADAVHDEISRVLILIREEEAALVCNRKVYAIYKKYGLRAPESVHQELRRMIADIEKQLSIAPTTSSKKHYYSSLALCYHCLNEHRNATQVLQSCIEMNDAMSVREFRERAELYLLHMSQLMTYAFNHRDPDYFDEIKAYVDKRVVDVSGLEEKRFEISIQSNFLSMIIHKDYSRVDENARYVDENMELFKKISLIIQGDITFNMSLGFLQNRNLDKALEWLLRAFELPGITGRDHMMVYARFYELLLHWKLNHTELVLSKTLAFKRYLQKNEALGEFERVCIRFMNAAILNDSTKGFAKALQNFGSDLQQLDSSQYAGIVRNYNELVEFFKAGT